MSEFVGQLRHIGHKEDTALITLVENIGKLVTGDGATVHEDTSILIEDGVIADIGADAAGVDTVIDANQLTAIPGLIDGHVHPSFGDWTPAQNSIGWVQKYSHGGVTQMVSAGEAHIPGLQLGDLTPDAAMSIAVAGLQSTGRLRLNGVKLHAGTLMVVPGLRESDFDRLAENGMRRLKFLFYDYASAPAGEAQEYVRWAHDRGMVVKIHAGGVSRSGVSRIADFEVISAIKPDIVAHISGGPIAMSDDDIRKVIDELPDTHVEICSSMNYRSTLETVSYLQQRGALERLTLGTDTPGGTGVIPRGMLRNICLLASVGKISAVAAIAAATSQVAGAHKVSGGLLDVGEPADLVLAGAVRGSAASDVIESFELGDLPGISLVLIDGVPVVSPISEQTPPPQRLADITRMAPAWRLRLPAAYPTA